MIEPTTPSLAELFNADETAWLETMAELIAQGRFGDLDYANLGEYLTDAVRRERTEVKSRLTLLIAHLLNWQHQPQSRTADWHGTIVTQRKELEDLLGQGVLRDYAESIRAEAYGHSLKLAAAESGLSVDTYPVVCPYSVEQLLSPELVRE
jgi:hypothetical protein